MPQTREHLDICQLLGVRAGVVALTKADLLPGLGDDWRALLDADLATLLAGSVLEQAEVVPVSAKTGEGLDALRDGARARRRERAAPARRRSAVPSCGPRVHHQGLRYRGDRDAALGDGRARGLRVAAAGASRSPPGSRRADPRPDHAPGIGGAAHRGEPLRRRDPRRAARDGAGPRGRAPRDALPRRGAHAACPPPRRRCPAGARSCSTSAPRRWRPGSPCSTCPSSRPGETGLAQLRLQAPVAALPGQRFILRGARPLPGRGATPRRRTGAHHRRAPAAAGRGRAARPDARRGPGRPAGRGSRDSPGTAG